MSKSSELRNLYRSFSGDRAVATHSRSGDSSGEGATLWDFIASVPSAESDIIDEEERAEQRTAKRKFAQLLGLYFKKILAPVEFKYLAACMQSNKTPYAIGRAMGVDYKTTIAAIKEKHAENLPKLRQLMRVCGYDYRRGFVLMPEWDIYLKHILSMWVRYQNLTPEQRQIKREKGRLAKQRERARNGEKINERQRQYRAENPERYAEYDRQRRERNKDKINAQRRERRAANRERFAVRDKLWRERNREKILAQRRNRYAANKDKINAQRRANRAEQRTEQRKALETIGG